MALDKLVDSTQLDADLTSVANAIRTKGGTSASLAFPADFVSAIAAIPTGGGGDPNENLAKLAKNTLTSVDLDVEGYAVKERLFNTAANLVTARLRNIGNGSGQYIFYNCANLETVVLSGASGGVVHLPSQTIRDTAKCKTVDLDNIDLHYGSALARSAKLDTLIIRNPSIAYLGNTNNFDSTPFKNGGTGGTIYIPKALYDHLGDGTSNDYCSATNWSTVYGWGTITWAKIEGSIYENAYADGTPIS